LYETPRARRHYCVIGQYTGVGNSQGTEFEVFFPALDTRFNMKMDWVHKHGSKTTPGEREVIDQECLDQWLLPDGAEPLWEEEEDPEVSNQVDQGKAPSISKPKRRPQRRLPKRGLDSDSDDSSVHSRSSNEADIEESTSTDVGNEWVEGAAPADSVLKFNGYKAKKTLVGKFGGSSPFEIAMYFLSDIIDHVVECTNLRLGGSDNDDGPLTVVEMYHWIGFRLFMTIINFPNTKIYFDEDVLSCFDIKLPNFSQILSYDRYCFINSFLTFEQYDNNISDAEKSETDPAWKVRTMTTMLKSKCQACLPSPKQHLSLDEGMAMCTLRRCPILHHVLNKPIDPIKLIPLTIVSIYRMDLLAIK
jgi:hypothetical protein